MNLSNINIVLNILINIKNFFIWIFKTKPKFKKSSYYFKHYHKHVTIYENGNGIVINSFDVVFNNKESVAIKRGTNIADGKKSAGFPDLEVMKNTDMKDRFDKYGFWVYSDDNIIEEVEEQYWTDYDEEEDIAAKNDIKELRWVFKLNMGKIILHKSYHVVYVISIPGMYPILNGEIDRSDIPPDPNSSSSSIEIITPIDQCKYTVSFYKSINLKTEPEAVFKEIGSAKSSYPLVTREYNIIYNKYICDVKRPQLGSKLKLTWKFN